GRAGDRRARCAGGGGLMTGKARGGLGKGLGALIPQGPAGGATAPRPISDVGTTTTLQDGQDGTEASDLAPVPGARFAEVRVDSITPNARQPRQVFDEDAMEELKVSIREVGFLQPIVVRESGAGAYELVMGERRWRAAQALGLQLIPAIVRDTRDDAMLRDALLE